MLKPHVKLMLRGQVCIHLKCKQHAPDATIACVLVPGYLLKPLQSLLSEMRVLNRYHKGSELFTDTDGCGARNSMREVLWPVY